MKLLVTALFALTVLAGCASPSTTVRAVNERPSIAIDGASKGTILVVDNIPIGPARKYDGKPKVLTLEPGTHLIQLRKNGTVVYSEKVFLGRRGTTTVAVGVGG